MKSQKRNQFHELLLSLRERVGGEVNHVVQSIQEEVNVNENQSAAPVHLADIAVEGIDANVTVLQTERGILDDINTALGRIADGTYGKCIDCGQSIAEERLKALPYTPYCVDCAQADADSSSRRRVSNVSKAREQVRAGERTTDIKVKRSPR